MMIHWCELCNAAPSDGVLTVIRTGETQPTLMRACNDCVNKLDVKDWIDDNLQER